MTCVSAVSATCLTLKGLTLKMKCKKSFLEKLLIKTNHRDTHQSWKSHLVTFDLWTAISHTWPRLPTQWQAQSQLRGKYLPKPGPGATMKPNQATLGLSRHNNHKVSLRNCQKGASKRGKWPILAGAHSDRQK